MSLLPASSDATTVDTLRAILRQNPSFQVPVLNAVQAESMVACLDAAVLGSRAVDAIDVFLDEPKNVETLKAARLPEQLEQLLRSAKFCRQEHITTVTIKSIDNILLALGRKARASCVTSVLHLFSSTRSFLCGNVLHEVLRLLCECVESAVAEGDAFAKMEEMAANFEQLVSDDDSLQSVHRLKSHIATRLFCRAIMGLSQFKSMGWKRLEDFAKKMPQESPISTSIRTSAKKQIYSDTVSQGDGMRIQANGCTATFVRDKVRVFAPELSRNSGSDFDRVVRALHMCEAKIEAYGVSHAPLPCLDVLITAKKEKGSKLCKIIVRMVFVDDGAGIERWMSSTEKKFLQLKLQQSCVLRTMPIVVDQRSDTPAMPTPKQQSTEKGNETHASSDTADPKNEISQHCDLKEMEAKSTSTLLLPHDDKDDVLLETVREPKESPLIHELDAQHQDEVEIADSSDYVLSGAQPSSLVVDDDDEEEEDYDDDDDDMAESNPDPCDSSSREDGSNVMHEGEQEEEEEEEEEVEDCAVYSDISVSESELCESPQSHIPELEKSFEEAEDESLLRYDDGTDINDDDDEEEEEEEVQETKNETTAEEDEEDEEEVAAQNACEAMSDGSDNDDVLSLFQKSMAKMRRKRQQKLQRKAKIAKESSVTWIDKTLTQQIKKVAGARDTVEQLKSTKVSALSIKIQGVHKDLEELLSRMSAIQSEILSCSSWQRETSSKLRENFKSLKKGFEKSCKRSASSALSQVQSDCEASRKRRRKISSALLAVLRDDL
eukprot:g3872.t1